MGNTSSNNINNNNQPTKSNSSIKTSSVETTAEVIDFIATYYILTMDFTKII